MALLWIDSLTEPQRPRQPKLPCTILNCQDPFCDRWHGGQEAEEPLECDSCGRDCDVLYTVEDRDDSVGYCGEVKVCSGCLDKPKR